MNATAQTRESREAVAETPAPPLDCTIAEAPLRAALAPAQHLNERQQIEAAKWRKLLALMLEAREGRSDWEAAGKVASEQQVSQRTVYRLYKKYERDGVNALAPKPFGPKKGSTGRFNGNRELKRFVAAKWAETGNLRSVEDATIREWLGPHLRHQKGDPPSYGAISRFIDSIPQPTRDVARLPKQKSDSRNAPYISTHRGRLTLPNEVWIPDHRQSDVIVANDCFPGAAQGEARRLWGTFIEDMRTRVIVAAVWNVTPSSRTIASALRQAIGIFGLPGTFYSDNGKDFKKIAAPGGLLARLGIQKLHCTPRHPQSKAVESFFNLVAQRFDKNFFGQGYTGSKPEMRPDFCRELEKKHAEFLAGKRQKSPLCTASHFVQLHRQFLKEYNETWAHSGEGMDGRAPLAVMDKLLPIAERRIPDMDELAPLFWEMEVRKVVNCKVRLGNVDYSVPLLDEESGRAMYDANGSMVAVYRDPENMACAMAYENTPGGNPLAVLVSDELAAQGRVTQDQIKAVCRLRAKLYKEAKQGWRLLSSGVPTENELLAQRGGIPSEPAHPLRLPGRAPRKVCPAFVNDAVDDGISFDNLELEAEPASPFVSDGFANLKKAFPPDKKAS